jgi:hypothetical protein
MFVLIMSSSFQSLNTKYQTLLALELSAAGGVGVVPDLQQVTDVGATTSNSINVDDGLGTYTIVARDFIQQLIPSGIITTIDTFGIQMTKNLVGGEDDVVLNQNSLTFTETQYNAPLPDTFQINSLSKGELRLEDVTNVLQIEPDDILINYVGGVNGQVLTYDSGLKWASSQFQSGTITFDPLDPVTMGTVTFSTPYIQVIAPKVFLTFNNNNSIVFINFAVRQINPDPILPAFIGFDWEISTESSILIDMSLSWFSLA